MKLYVIAAVCKNMGIGVGNSLPWSLKGEWEYYTRMSSQTENPEKKNVVVMGRRTWESIPEDSRPLSGRINAVLSSREFEGPPEVLSYKSWEDAMEDLASPEKQMLIEKVWITGGTDIYKTAMESSSCYRIYLTRISADFKCDTFFPEFDKNIYKLIKDPQVPDELQEENGIQYQFEVYERVELNN